MMKTFSLFVCILFPGLSLAGGGGGGGGVRPEMSVFSSPDTVIIRDGAEVHSKDYGAIIDLNGQFIPIQYAFTRQSQAEGPQVFVGGYNSKNQFIFTQATQTEIMTENVDFAAQKSIVSKQWESVR